MGPQKQQDQENQQYPPLVSTLMHIPVHMYLHTHMYLYTLTPITQHKHVKEKRVLFEHQEKSEGKEGHIRLVSLTFKDDLTVSD